MPDRADYGIDAPPVVRNFVLVGVTGTLAFVGARCCLRSRQAPRRSRAR